MTLPRARIVPVLVTLAAGAAIGTVGALAAKFDSPIFHVLGLIFSGGWSWACFAFLVGYFRPSKIEAAWLASSALAVGVVVYYLLKAWSPVTPIGMVDSGEPIEGTVSSGILYWALAAFFFGAPLGLFGNLARIPGIAGLPLRLLAPLIAYVETSERLNVEAATAGPLAEATWTTIRVLAVLTAVALVGQTAWTWRRRYNSAKAGADSN
ncbi:hypothetical protein ACIPYQ_12875 [Streptomyces sp. NPDC090045]|uniref:hypothetical protein n=1 Tax=Streptomyces sp. NPDC090045 TaxID=3365927 RepID=UPI003800D631